jgi:putative heme-binding domain-containing protein
VLSSATANPAGLLTRLYSPEFAARPGGLALLQPLLFVIGARGKKDELALTIDALGAKESDKWPELVYSLGDGLARSKRDLAPGLPMMGIRAEWLNQLLTRAEVDVWKVDLPASQRAQYVALIGLQHDEAAKSTLANLAENTEAPEVQTAVLHALARFEAPEVAAILLKRWKNYTPRMRADVVGTLLSRRVWTAPLLIAVKDGRIPPTLVPPARRTVLLQDRDPALRKLAEEAFATLVTGPRSEAVAQYKPAIEHAGDPDRGRAVFDRECQVCHKLGDRGNAVGPNLAGVRHRTAEEILVNILDPNREVSPEFLEYMVALDDGRVVTGLVAAETPNSVTLRAREGAEQTILRKNIEEIRSTGKSLMPEGLEKTVTPAEMKDLIAFLLKIQD